MPTGLGIPGGLPGIRAEVTSSEGEIFAHPAGSIIYDPLPLIDSGAVDTGSPVTTLRPGLVMAKKTADGNWYEYLKAATDGREQALGVLMRGVNMLGPDGTVEDKLGGPNVIAIGGRLKAAELQGLDTLARNQLSKNFKFDDDILGTDWFGGWRKEEIGRAHV